MVRDRFPGHVYHDCIVRTSNRSHQCSSPSRVLRAHNIQTVIIARFLQGAFGSTAATMVGGTIADIWAPAE